MTRTILFGLDGATFTVLDPLMAAGVMPELRAFMARGVRAELMSTPHPVTPPAWTTVMTGRGPGQHGILDFLRPEEGKNGIYVKVTDSRDNRCETIWSIASRQNRRVAALNFYGMSPPQPLAGYSIPGFVPARHMRRGSHPADLFDRLARHGLDGKRLGMDLDQEKKAIQGFAPELCADWIRSHIQREQQWFETLRFIMQTDPCDLTAIVFDGVDKIQHLCWRMLDPVLAAAASGPLDTQIRKLCLEYFRQIDGFLGEVVRLAGAEADIFIVSDHGFCASTEIVYINTWLAAQGFLRWSSDTPVDTGEGLMAHRMKTHAAMLDWSETRAYALTPSSNGIFIRGVAPEAYGAVRQSVIEALERLQDPATGAAIVTQILTREEAFPGACMLAAPDLTLALRDHGLVSVLRGPAPVQRRSSPVGTHHPAGVFVAAGPTVRRGATLPALPLIDVAPSLLYSLGLPVPEDLEGGVIEAAFLPEALHARPVQAGPPTVSPGASPAPPGEFELDAKEEQEVMDRLRSLGYLD
jgi:predicted AlkP superfamily phosphohydrolase/phosphomutase